jgi:hypothetical protein
MVARNDLRVTFYVYCPSC